MAIVESNAFKYPAEEECLVRRLGSGVIAAWTSCRKNRREPILARRASPGTANYNIPRLNDRLDGSSAVASRGYGAAGDGAPIGRLGVPGQRLLRSVEQRRRTCRRPP